MSKTRSLKKNIERGSELKPEELEKSMISSFNVECLYPVEEATASPGSFRLDGNESEPGFFIFQSPGKYSPCKYFLVK